MFINRLKRKDLIISLLLVAYKSHIKVLKVINHSRFRFKFISKLLEGFKKSEVNNFSKQFAIYIFNNFKNKKIYEKLLNAKKITKDVYIVSASADFYCKFLARLFDVKLISTNVNLHKKNFGQLVGKNCFGNEKKLRVLSTIKNFKKNILFFLQIRNLIYLF